MAQGLNGSRLTGGRGGHNGKLVQLGHLLNNRCRPQCITQAPAGHGIGLGKTVDNHRALCHAGHGSNGGVVHTAVGQLAVNLIGQHINLVLLQHSTNGLQVLPAHHRSGGIVRVWEHQQLGLRRNSSFQRGSRQTEVVFFLRYQRHSHAAANLYQRFVAHKGRLHHQHLITGAHQCADGHINAFGTANCHQHLIFSPVLQMIPAGIEGTDLLPQGQQPGIGGVAGSAPI